MKGVELVIGTFGFELEDGRLCFRVPRPNISTSGL